MAEANPMLEKTKKLFESRSRTEADLKRYHQKVEDAVQQKNRSCRVERLVKSCTETMSKLVGKHELLLDHSKKTENPEVVTLELETWLKEVTATNDRVLGTARDYIDQCKTMCKLVDYIDQCPPTESASQESKATTTHKTASSRQTKTSSQKALLIAQQRREEVERQNAAALRLAKQKQELEQETLKKQQALHVAELEEENRQRLAEATLTELQLTDDVSETNSQFQDTLSRLSKASNDNNARVNDWVNNLPSATVAEGHIDTSHGLPEVNTVNPSEDQGSGPLFWGPEGVNNPVFNNLPQAATTVEPFLAVTHPIPLSQPQPVRNATPMNVTARQFIPAPQHHGVPNLSAWSFPAATSNRQNTAQVAATIPVGNTVPAPTLSYPVTCAGTVYYSNPVPATGAVPSGIPLPPSVPTAAPFTTVMPAQPTQNSFSIQDLAQLLASSKRDHLPEWKLSQFNGDPLLWHEWYGQFKSAIDSSPLTDDVKLTYLKTLVSGKAKTAIIEFTYCGTMYKDALKTLERKFGQPQAVVTAYLEKLSNFPQVKIHNSENIISYSATVSALVGVFRSLNYQQDLRSATLLGQAVQKLPPNLKEAWSLHTVRRSLDRPTLIEFNDWLKEKAEAHERMKMASSKPKSDDASTGNVTKTKTGTNVFAAMTSNQASSAKTTSDKRCMACKDSHPLWRCPTFLAKTPTERTKLAVQYRLCFSCLNKDHSFRQCPKARKCTKEGCTSSHNTLLHGSERIFPPRRPTDERSTVTRTSPTARETQHSTGESSSLCAVSDVKGLLQIAQVELQSPVNSVKTLVVCDTACSRSWISRRLADQLQLKGSPTKLTVHGINSHEVVNTEIVELKLTPVHSVNSCPPFSVKPYVRKNLNVGTDVIDVDVLKTRYPHLDPIPLAEYRYEDVEMILGQDVFHAIRPLEYLETDRKDTPTAVRLPLGWVLSGPLLSTSGFVSTCFKAVSRSEEDTKLVDHKQSCYDTEPYSARKRVEPRSVADCRASKTQEETYHDGCRYHVGTLRTVKESSLPSNYFSVLTQRNSLERRLGKEVELKDYVPTRSRRSKWSKQALWSGSLPD